MVKTAGWNFDNSYTELPDTFFSEQKPVPVNSPELIIFNNQLAANLGLNGEDLQNNGVEFFAGNNLPEGSEPLAQAYAGHQFGHFTMLGDGRAVLLGEQITPEGERVDIQLKGSGRTPYSRGGDGRATLGPMLREYIISEAMHALGIPTTRSLAVVTTGEEVARETYLPGAVLTRVGASHLRVGTFEYASRFCEVDELRALADYAIERHYPELNSEKKPYLAFLQKVMERQASLISKWQLVGFIHGVMNTDNMTISGETIDYGPCAFMDAYDPATVFSSIDRDGRYAYGNQPYIGVWNLTRLAESLLPLLHDNQDEAIEIAQNQLGKFKDMYFSNWFDGMRSKLGLFSEESGDETLFKDLLEMMHKHRADYTNTFRALTEDRLEGAIFDTEEFHDWHDRWKNRLDEQKQSREESHALMQKSNPVVIPRNHRVEEALDAAVEKEDYTVMERLLEVLSEPYSSREGIEEYMVPAPEEISCNYQTFCGT